MFDTDGFATTESRNQDFEGTAQGSWRDYFQSQIKVAAMIRKGVSF